MECFQQADVCFVIDSSGSICENDAFTTSCSSWKLLLSFITNVLMHLILDTIRLELVLSYSLMMHYLAIPMNLYLNSNSLKVAVQSLNHLGGQTNTGKALHVTRTQCLLEPMAKGKMFPTLP